MSVRVDLGGRRNIKKKKFASEDTRHKDEPAEFDGWVTRERVGEIISDVLAMMGASSDKNVQTHFDMVKIILQTSDAPTQNDLARRLGLTKQAISVRVLKLAAHAGQIAPGLLSRMRQSQAAADDNNLNDFSDGYMTKGVHKKSINPPSVRRGASTTAKKHGFSSKGGQETHQA